ncbi:MAG TPA: aminoglycoside phosphotransferase family protein [Dongiaceae bacterium]|jgi:streptomycin 6-kinase|nr:aminoglycoside phosphotransferase family protein [Dongiaceae bacterium]
MFDDHLKRWSLIPDGEPIVTHCSHLLPVLCGGVPAMLKIAHEEEERRGPDLMIWWNGDGAARVLARDGDAVLLERATGHRSLVQMAREDHDDEASRIICRVAARLHAPRRQALPELIPLRQWFAELEPAASKHGGILARAAAVARELLDQPREVGVLHGDLHHGNVLDFGERGWFAIDPKRLLGERGFDFANILRNPDLDIAKAPGRLARQATIIAEAARLDRTRLLRWILAYAGLFAVWILGDGDDATLDLTVAEIAAAEIAAG